MEAQFQMRFSLYILTRTLPVISFGISTPASVKRRCDVAERARMHFLDAVRDHDERHGVRRVLRERLVRLVVPHLVRIAVIRRDADLAADFANGIDESPDAGINGFNGLDDCREDTRMTDHIAIGIVQNDEIVLTALDSVDDFIRDFNGTHLGL